MKNAAYTFCARDNFPTHIYRGFILVSMTKDRYLKFEFTGDHYCSKIATRNSETVVNFIFMSTLFKI